MCETSDSIRGKTGTGSVLSLDAVGRQELFLNGTDQIFNGSFKRHSNFTMYQSVINIKATQGVVNWPFGQTILVTLYPQQMGDLLKNMYLKCQLPLLQDVLQNGTTYIDQVGRALINSIQFSIDGITIEKIYGDWNVIRDQIYLSADEKVGLQGLINGGNPEGSPRQSGPIDLYIPLNLFFSNNDASFFPVCAILQQKIYITIEFNKVSFFSDTHTPEMFPGSEFQCSLSGFDIVYEQIIVTPEERLYLQSIDYTLLIETVRLQPVLDIPILTPRVKNYLVPNIPVETFHWFYRKTIFENPKTIDPDIIFNRFNFSNSNSQSLSVQSNNPVLSDAVIFILGDSQLGFFENSYHNNPQTHYYYKYLEPLTSGFSSPTRNVYTFTFALDPSDGPLTGALDFGKITGTDQSFIDSSIMSSAEGSNFQMHIFFVALVNLKFSGGFMKQFL